MISSSLSQVQFLRIMLAFLLTRRRRCRKPHLSAFISKFISSTYLAVSMEPVSQHELAVVRFLVNTPRNLCVGTSYKT